MLEELEEAYGDGRVFFVSLTDAPRSSHMAAARRNRYVDEVFGTAAFGMRGGIFLRVVPIA